MPKIMSAWASGGAHGIVAPGLFRLILAGMVIASHLSRLNTGRIGVMLFFVLSGYWISRLWLRQTGRWRAASFATNRFLRIWPLYLVAVAMSWWLYARPLDVPTFTILGVASTPGLRQLGVEWSLDIEAQFYLLIPLLLLALTPLRVLLLTVVGWVVFEWATISTVLMYLPAFALGMLMFQRRAHPLLVPPLLSLLAFAMLTALLVALPATRGIVIGNGGAIPLDRDIVAMLWMLPLLPYVEASLRIRSTPLDRHLGNLSYPFYLVQEPLIQFFTNAGWSKVAIAAGVTIVATLLYVAIDIPVERFRYRVLERLNARFRPQTSGASRASSAGIAT